MKQWEQDETPQPQYPSIEARRNSINTLVNWNSFFQKKTLVEYSNVNRSSYCTATLTHSKDLTWTLNKNHNATYPLPSMFHFHLPRFKWSEDQRFYFDKIIESVSKIKHQRISFKHNDLTIVFLKLFIELTQIREKGSNIWRLSWYKTIAPWPLPWQWPDILTWQWQQVKWHWQNLIW